MQDRHGHADVVRLTLMAVTEPQERLGAWHVPTRLIHRCVLHYGNDVLRGDGNLGQQRLLDCFVSAVRVVVRHVPLIHIHDVPLVEGSSSSLCVHMCGIQCTSASKVEGHFETNQRYLHTVSRTQRA